MQLVIYPRFLVPDREEKDGKKPKKEENQKGESSEKQSPKKIPKENRLGHGSPSLWSIDENSRESALGSQ
jgi:hypothetical protein